MKQRLLIFLTFLCGCTLCYVAGMRSAFRTAALGSAKAYFDQVSGSLATPVGAGKAQQRYGAVQHFEILEVGPQGPLGIPVHVRVKVQRGGKLHIETLAYYSSQIGWPRALTVDVDANDS